MSDSTSHSTGKAARPVNRWGVGTLSAIQIGLSVLILIAVNFLATRHYTLLDLSHDGSFTLSPKTKSYLVAGELSRRAKPVKFFVALRRTTPFYDQVRILAEEYARLAQGKIELEFVDDQRNPNRAQQVMAAYELAFVRDLIIIDARTDDSPAVTMRSGVRTLNPHVRIVVAEEMVLRKNDPQGQRRPGSFQGEDLMTAGLVRALEGRARELLLLADKSKLDAEGSDSPWQSLESTMRMQNTQLKSASLAGMTDIPAGTEGVVLVAPRYDLTDAEVTVLERYWSRPRAALLVLLEPGRSLPKLRAFLRGKGITPQNDRIVAKERGTLVNQARGTFSAGLDFLKDLAGQTSEFEGASASLEVRENAEDLLGRKIFPFGIFQVADGFWGESKFGEGEPVFDKIEDHAGPLQLAACVTRGSSATDALAGETSRMVVVANTDFLKPENQRAENMDFLASSVNWLVGREELAGIGPRLLRTYKLPILEAQVAFINRVNWFFLPALLTVIGLFIWSSRRA